MAFKTTARLNSDTVTSWDKTQIKSASFGQITMMQRSHLESLKRPPNGTLIGRFQLRGKKLRSHSVNDMGGFLNSLEAQKGIEPWQVDQARKALTFLYRLSGLTFGRKNRSEKVQRAWLAGAPMNFPAKFQGS
ncbi:MAG: hypothetical protein Q8P24_06610 [Desulfobacterales bacterium]|nr:hypothetical protein [Desulfobacterales bacterium]